MSRAIITVDLGYGDSGKGTVVDALVRKYRSGLVVRYNGGSQCGHNVVTDDGLHHEFAQFGSGSFAGAKTLLSRHVLVNPLDMVEEARVLTPKLGTNPLHDMYVDSRALITTPYHVALNRIREKSRSKRNGSCGKGIRETVVYAERNPASAITARDLNVHPILSSKLAVMQIKCLCEARALAEYDDLNFQDEFEVLEQNSTELANRLLEAGDWFGLCSPEQVGALIRNERNVIFEGAQGILLDQHYGFRPHITKSSCVSTNAHEILDEMGFDGQRFDLGITRTYLTKHGAGPFPSEDAKLTEMLPDAHNHYNDWQQDFRVGHLDIPALKYAVECNDGIDGLAITHLDTMALQPSWKIVTTYQRPDLVTYNLVKRDGQRATQEAITRELYKVKTYGVFASGEKIPSMLSQALGVPIRLTSSGPAFMHKTFCGELEDDE